ncbi:DoxX family protein [Desertihabitans aurantiacus]|uniref:DoxX family protein n=1 Tax=Desertihabitans aurantiacus TaxID=2282477 RepID=UPI000DF7FE36|nr:DoxX family protein [Desertihabitans aurantiacus]
MLLVYLVITLVTIVANTAIAVADLRRSAFVVANATEVGVPASWLPLLGALKAAGAAGLLAGLVGVAVQVPLLTRLGLVSAAGLVLFFSGALVTHLRAGVLHNLHVPAAYWLLAVASAGSLLVVG